MMADAAGGATTCAAGDAAADAARDATTCAAGDAAADAAAYAARDATTCAAGDAAADAAFLINEECLIPLIEAAEQPPLLNIKKVSNGKLGDNDVI